ncbi:hypothetical protein MJH54_30485, partial [Salmonella enterica subsp. enterica serovar Montevideo]|nr:hypothetical protein [Salmonella enterica subsp. enterica serovar Montevideo]
RPLGMRRHRVKQRAQLLIYVPPPKSAFQHHRRPGLPHPQTAKNYNYGPFSDAMYGDVRPLLDKPELVADTWMNLASAVFFFVYP